MKLTTLKRLTITSVMVALTAFATQANHAQVVDLTFSTPMPPTSATTTAIFGFNIIGSEAVSIDQVGGTVDLNQFNDDSLGFTDRTLDAVATGGITSIAEVVFGELLTTSTFASGNTSLSIGDAAADPNPTFVGFIDGTNNIGYFQVDFVDGGNVTYSNGEYNTIAGASLTVGTVTVPEPTAVAFLSTLVIGIGARRKRVL